MEKLAAKSGEQHSEEEWEAIRPTFGLLYKAQGRPLSEVRRLLAEWFGFHAT
ncbi:hypothetical protein GQ53DRAFT_746572 [Thozetella sp. PMI_491]|nr:hypothetical protein GQ53DRAFT_746572 [Thozetella sp. PMI_491]